MSVILHFSDIKLTIDGKNAIEELKKYKYEDDPDDKWTAYDAIDNGYWFYIKSDVLVKRISLAHPDKEVRLILKTDLDDEPEGFKALNGKVKKLKQAWI